jgi:peptidoglycan-associated lipoprotein
MNMKFAGAAAIAALLGACSSTPPAATTGASTGAGTTITATPGVGPGSEEDLATNVGDKVFFAFDKSNLTPEDQATLDRQAGWLQQYPQVQVQVAGNTDDRGTEEYNLALGQRRANAARDYLVARGVNSARIDTISFGKDRPIALGDNEQAWAQNRNAITSVRNTNISMR